MSSLIVNADDFGASELHTNVTFELLDKGMLTSSTFLLNRPYAEEAARRLREERPDLIPHIGLHGNWVDSKPLSKAMQAAPWLSPEGEMRDFRQVLGKATQWREAKRLALELDAQILRFKEWVGEYPAHLDFHAHSHISVGGLRALRLSKEARHIQAIRPARIYPFIPAGSSKEKLRRLGVRWVNAILRRRFRTVGAFIDIRHRNSQFIKRSYLEKVLQKYGSVELMCHPNLGRDMAEYEYMTQSGLLGNLEGHEMRSYAEWLSTSRS